jgi:hypothetical protein
MKNEEVKNLADKIAQLISTESKKTDLSTLFASIEKINHRLEKLENENRVPVPSVHQPLLTHASQDRFAVAEAITDALFDLKSKEKACSFEPNGKPCDHCSMCSSRGF